MEKRGLDGVGWWWRAVICAVLMAVGGVALAQSGTAGSSTAGAAAAKPETQMTKEQAKELFDSVDTILQFVSKDSKLPIVHAVKPKLISRAEVNQTLLKKFNEDKGAKKMEQDEIVLKKFGLLDQDFHLRPFLISLLTEQIAGFYDNKTKTVNLLDWIQPEKQKPVLAHELTHALQDQKVNLEKWSDPEPEGVSKNVKEDNQRIQTDEAATAREAVAEGQAMAVFIDYSLQGSGKTLATAPELADKLKNSGSDTSDSPVLARAPLLLQQSLLFPYDEGLAFEDRILVKAGVNVAFAGVLDHPPSSSFEIMHPDAYLAHAPVPVLLLPDLHPLLDSAYAPYDIGVMGELDVRMLTELFGGQEMAEALSPEWAGGVYYALQRKSATVAEKATTASLGLLYYSRWKNADSARSFLRVYAGELARKYAAVTRREKDEAEGEQIYSTNEGDVLLSISDKGVYVGEGFDLALSRKLRDSIESVQASGPLMTAGVDNIQGGELGMGLVRDLASFGVVQAALK